MCIILKNQIFITIVISTIYLPLYSQTKIVNLSNTDFMCINRFTEEPASSNIQVVVNPWKTAKNSSNNVLRVYDVNKSGMIWLNLYKYFDSATSSLINLPDENKIDLTVNQQYRGLRFKYFVKGNTLGANLTSKIILQGNIVQQSSIAWSSTKESGVYWDDWNTVSFKFTVDIHCERIQLNVFQGGSYSSSITPGLEVFIDDIEFFDPTIAGVQATKNEKLSFLVRNKQLTVSDLTLNSIFSVYDIYGRNIYRSIVSTDNIHYTFIKSGIFLLNINDGVICKTEKIIVN